MTNFIRADELKIKYEVYANFYKMKQLDGEIHICRNVADIYEVGYIRKNPNSLPKAIIIMMNPGKCEPKSSKQFIPVLSAKDLEDMSKKSPAILCKPDNAQYQIMRIMYAKGWNHVRIVNLSDIKCSNGDEFKKILKLLLNLDKDHIHSIFSDRRMKERESLCTLDKEAPIILGWGTDKILLNLAMKCVSCIPLKNAKGILHSKNLYYYPSPPPKVMKEEWLDKILNII
ncbi:MAG: hypothetical protein F8N39_18060 [Clostridiaceae bacterium]|nr:hypothetical protein [Clostridiaceae bacterium]